METINLKGCDYKILKEYDSAICLYDTTGIVIQTSKMIEINFGQEIYDVKLLKIEGLIFKISKNDDYYVLHKIPQFFGFPSEFEMSEIIEYKKQMSELQNRVSKIVNCIKINP